MSISEIILPEFDHETAATRVLLERVPEGQAAWTPHARSRSLGELAMHIAGLPIWVSIALERTEFDTNPPEGEPPAAPAFESSAALLQRYDGNVAAARALLVRATDPEFMAQWTLKDGGKAVYSLPRLLVLRTFALNHLVHHRGQLSVYLRLLDIPLPSLYGPTADTPTRSGDRSGHSGHSGV